MSGTPSLSGRALNWSPGAGLLAGLLVGAVIGAALGAMPVGVAAGVGLGALVDWLRHRPPAEKSKDMDITSRS